MAARITEEFRREPGWIGRDERTPVRIEGLARRNGEGQPMAVTIHDLSREGCRIEGEDTTFEIGEWLQLEVAGLQTFRAQVRWALFESAGVQFEA